MLVFSLLACVYCTDEEKIYKGVFGKNKKITLGDLAGAIDSLTSMTARSFESVDSQFDKVNKRLDKIEVRLDDFELRLERIENRILMNHENRFDRLEDKIRTLETACK